MRAVAAGRAAAADERRPGRDPRRDRRPGGDGRPARGPLPGVLGAAARRAARRTGRAGRRGGGRPGARGARGDRQRRRGPAAAVQPGGEHRHRSWPCPGSATRWSRPAPVVGRVADHRRRAGARHGRQCLAALGVETSAAAVAAAYGPALLDGWLVDTGDADAVPVSRPPASPAAPVPLLMPDVPAAAAWPGGACALADRARGRPMSGRCSVWAPDGLPESRPATTWPPLLAAVAAEASAGRRRRPGRHLEGRQQGRGPGRCGATARRRSPPRPSAWSPAAAGPGSSRPGTAWCWRPPGRRVQHRARHGACCCPRTPTPRPARCAAGCSSGRASTSAWSSATPSAGPGGSARPTSPSASPASPPLDDLRGRDRRPRQRLDVDRDRGRRRDRRRRRAGQGQARPAGRSPSSAGCPTWSPPSRRARVPPALVRPAAEDMFRLGRARRRARPPHGARPSPTSRWTRPRAARRRRRASPRRRRTTRRPGGSSSSTTPDARTAARRDARRLGRRPAARRLHRRADRAADPARRGAARRAATWSCRAWSRRRARLPRRAAGNAPSARCSSSRRAPASRTCSSRWPWRGSARPGCRSTMFCRRRRRPRARPARRLGADGRRRRRPRRARRRAPAPRPRRLPDARLSACGPSVLAGTRVRPWPYIAR